MLRPITLILITLLLTACKSKSQENLNVPKSLKLFREGSDLMMQGFKIEFDDSLGAQKYYRNSVNKFTAAYQADTTNLKLCGYLDYVYYKIQKYDSALYWAQRLFTLDSVENFDQKTASRSYSFFGKCLIYEGDLTNGKKYFQMALNADTTQIFILTQTLSDIADQFYFKTIPIQLNKLKTINPCKYSIDIMRLGLDIGKNKNVATDFLFSSTKIQEREKSCR